MEYGCIGFPLKHSFSKEIHSLIADYEYELKEIEPEGLPCFMKEGDFKGINVTIPHKREVIPFLYKIDENAKKIGAVNTVVNEAGRLCGYNTDFLGLRALILKTGISLKDKRVAILGSGGTSRTANAVCESLGAKEIFRISRSKKEGFFTYDELTSFKASQIIINTTPLGMYPEISPSPIALEQFPQLEAVVDAVYNPLCSTIVLQGKDRGIKAVGGLYMLVAQAVFASKLFSGEQPECDNALPIIESVYEKVLSLKKNIVLIGMPSSGKTTIGKIIADKLQRDFLDTDALIEKAAGIPISELIKTRGEEHFRALEREVIAEASKKSSAVISTGGGAVLNRENVFDLRKNGSIIFIDRPLDKLISTPSRPLSSNPELLKKRFEERYHTYISSADIIFSPTDIKEENAEGIIREFFERLKNEGND